MSCQTPLNLTFIGQVGRAGMFGSKVLAITFIDTSDDSKALDKVQKRFGVNIKHFLEQIDNSNYSTTLSPIFCMYIILFFIFP